MFRFKPSVLIALLILISLPAAVLADPNAPSPGGASFPVIAQGVSPIAGDEVAWRVVADIAQTPDDSESLERALGFVIAAEDAVLITDENSGAQQRLAAAEAAFVPQDALQRHESLGPDPTPYYRIALVPPADAEFTAGGDLILAGESFPAPAGDRDLDLILGDIPHGESEQIPGYIFPTVVLALTDGLSIGGNEDGGEATVLNAGESAVISGSRQLEAIGTGAAIFVAAVIGPDINGTVDTPIDSTDETDNGDDNAATTDGNGQIAVWVYACPSDVTFQDLAVPYPTGICELDYDATFASLLNDDLPGGELTLDDLVEGEGSVFWSVPYGTYSLATDNSVQVIVEPTDALGETEGNTAVLWPLTVSESTPNLTVGIYLLQ